MRQMFKRLSFFVAAICAMLTGASAQSHTYLWSWGSDIQTPGHPVVFDYYTNAGRDIALTVDLYRVPLERVVASVRDGRSFQATDAATLTRVGHATASYVANTYSDDRRVVVPVSGTGYFLAVAHLGDATDVKLVDVTSFGLATIVAGSNRLLFATDLSSFNHATGVRVSVEVRDRSIELAFNSSGLYVLPQRAWNHGVVFAQARDGSAYVQSVDRYGSQAVQELSYIQTDRPIYRPGQWIDLRAIVRAGTIGDYTIPSGNRAVRVTAPDGTTVFSRTLPLSAFGSVHASVPLAPDASLGGYTITVGASTRVVYVAAYKKPEYELNLTPSKTFVVGGDRISFALGARYFFGRPAAGMHLHYTAYRQSQPVFWWGPYDFIEGNRWYGSRTKVAEGEFVTDAEGHNTVALDTTKATGLEQLTVTVDGRDASGRTVTTDATIPLTPASFSLALEPRDWFAQAGVGTPITIHARSYTDAPRAAAKIDVTIHGERYDRRSGREIETGETHVSVTTDEHGDATFTWVPKEGGSYRFSAVSSDERGLEAKAGLYLWALGAGEESWFAPMERPVIIAEKKSFKPGERPRVLITLPKPGRDVAIVVVSDRLVDARVLHVQGTTTAFEVPVPKDTSHLAVTAMLPNESGIDTATAQIVIAPAPRTLSVTLAPRKPRYAPGERALFDVHVSDLQGKPVRAELGLGVVDEALYAVQAENAGDPFETFYDRTAYAWGNAPWYQPNRGLKMIAKVSSAASGSPVRAGVTADVYSVNGSIANAPIRSNFQDNAYWSPSVVTDEHGHAVVTFTWPDNLTTWRATGIAVSRATDIGRGTGNALVTKDFLVRLEAPRFLRVGDHSSIIGIAHGLSTHPGVTMRLDAPALGASGADVHRDLGVNGDADATWPVVVPGVGQTMLTLRGGDGTHTDGMQSLLPLLGSTAMEHRRDAGTLPGSTQLELALPSGDVAGDLHLTLAPSIVAQLLQSVRLFDVYPYYCTEQTTSTALPAAELGELARTYHLALPSDVAPKTIMAHAIDRLRELQHADGAWGWWENDQSEPFMTAYAVYGLAQMRAAGAPVDGMLERGADALATQYDTTPGERLRAYGGGERGDEWNVRAFMLMALAQAEPDSASRKLSTLFAHLHEMDPYGLAVAGLTAHTVHDDQRARIALRELDRLAAQNGPYVFWHREAWDWEWTSDPIETTSYVLRLYSAVEPTSPRVGEIVNFLRSERRGDWWYTTKDSAAAVVAIAQALHPQPEELNPDETIRVFVGERVVKELHITTPLLDAGEAHIVVPASELYGGATVHFERSGRGALYWASDWERYLPPSAHRASDADEPLLKRLFAKPPALSVERTYHASHEGPWRVGDEIDVELAVQSRDAVRYVAIEDPFPAGAEHQPLQGSAGEDSWSGFQFLDDRATFFASYLWPGETLRLHYTLRVTTQGRYAAPPPDAFAMYGPPVSAVGSPQTVTVTP